MEKTPCNENTRSTTIYHFDQSGYLKGRYIGQNIRILEDVSIFHKPK